jgi:hypothetical protein
MNMKNYTITVNGNVYDVVVEEGASTGAPVARAAAPKAAPVAAPKAAPAAPKASGAAGSIKVEAGAAGKIFKIEKTGQECFVTSRPVRKADNCWSVMARLIDDDYSSVLDEDVVKGDTTRFVGNAKPKLHETGFIKYQSNIERMRNYMTQIRVDDSYSQKYALMEDTFIKVAKGDGQGNMSEKVYKLDDVTFNIPRDRKGKEKYLEKWIFSSKKGDIDLVFQPILDRHDATNALIISQDAHQVFGYFSGKFIVGNEVIEINNMLGFAEKVKNRW